MERIIKRIKVDSKNKKSCYICNKYSYIAELHHLITIATVNKILIEIKNNKEMNFENCFDKINEIVEGIYLCPNHHTLYHKLLSEDCVETILMLNNNERKKYSELFEYAKKTHEIFIRYLTKINVKENSKRQIVKENMKIETTLGILQEIQKNN